jgi:cytochrome c-type biogenesis protein CcmH/NrfF
MRTAPGILAQCVAALLLLFCPTLTAQERTPAEAEQMYLEVGAQMRCVCGGCRDELLECSHTNCSHKLVQRAYLKELCQDATLDHPAIRQSMVARFGERALQVPPESHLYVVLGIALLVLGGAFGGMFWYLAGKRRAAEPAAQEDEVAHRGETELRIERDMRELQ